MGLQRVAIVYKIKLPIFHLSGADGLRLLSKEEFPFVHLSWILLRHLVPIFCGLARSVVYGKCKTVDVTSEILISHVEHFLGQVNSSHVYHHLRIKVG